MVSDPADVDPVTVAMDNRAGTFTPRVPVNPAEIDVAALYLARTYGNDTSAAALKRWADRIRQWARRPRPGAPVRQYGKVGRRVVYDLAELDVRARLTDPDGDGS